MGKNSAGVTEIANNLDNYSAPLNTALAQVADNVRGYLTVSMVGTGDRTLLVTDDNPEGRVPILRLIGTQTVSRNVLVPTTGALRRFLVWNDTLEGGAGTTITVKVSGGTGVTVARGYARDLWHDGTNVYPAGPEVAVSGPTAGNGIVAFWKLDEASGTRNDSVGSNHLTDNNTVTQAAGKVGSAAQFTAVNSEFLSIADNANLSTGDIDFTFACWVYLDTKTGVRDFITKWGASGQFEYLLLYNNGTDRFEWYVSSNGALTATATASTFGSPSVSTWYFVVVYHDSVNNLIGISVNNGAFNTVAHTTGVFNSTSPFQLGGRSVAPAYHNGRMDEVGFWKRMLTPTEITYLYNAGAGRTYPF